MNIGFNPNLTTNAINTFNIETTGYIVGTAQDDPAMRYQLAGGPLASTETLPMWGGIPIVAAIPNSTLAGADALGTPITRAISGVSISGFSVFDQNHAMINWPQSPVPQAGTGMNVNYYKYGSRARVALAMNPALASLVGSPVESQISWDFFNNYVSTYQASYLANVLTAQSWGSGAGGTLTYTTTSAHGLSVGSSFTITGSTPAGYNGTFIAASGTTGSTIVATGTGATPGASSVLGTLSAGGGALPVKILDMNIGNSMVPVFNAITQALTWNYTGNAILVQL